MTKHALHLGKFLGIDVYVHWTFSLLLLFVVSFADGMHEQFGGVIPAVAFVLAIFGCVLLHEFGHCLAARRYGIETRQITLLPIGGVAELESMPRDPRQELVVAIAGPAVNVVIAAVLWAMGSLGGWLFSPNAGILANLLSFLMASNLVLVIFNLIPAFPMDGGRVLRALLARKHGHLAATETAAGLGQALAFLLGIIGLLNIATNPMLVVLAFFVWRAATVEREMARFQAEFSYPGRSSFFPPAYQRREGWPESSKFTVSGDGVPVEIIPPQRKSPQRLINVEIVRKNWATD